MKMGFIKRSDGDADHVIEKVFDDVGEVLEEIARRAAPDEPPAMGEIPGAELPPDEKVN